MKHKINTTIKKAKSNIILFIRPKFRYIGDLRYIQKELEENNNYMYIYSIIDHFSKFLGHFY